MSELDPTMGPIERAYRQGWNEAIEAAIEITEQWERESYPGNFRTLVGRINDKIKQ